MATALSYASGYFFLGLSLGATLALTESASGRSNIGDIRSRPTRSPQTRQPSPASSGTAIRHGPAKFQQLSNSINYTAETGISVRNRPPSRVAPKPKVTPVKKQTVIRGTARRSYNIPKYNYGSEVMTE